MARAVTPKANYYSSNVIKTVPEVKDICKIIVDNSEIVIVKFQNETEEDRIKLLATGCFNGTELLYSITKRDSTSQKQYVKIINIHNEAFTFDYGGGSSTCVGTSTIKKNNLIKNFLRMAGVRNID